MVLVTGYLLHRPHRGWRGRYLVHSLVYNPPPFSQNCLSGTLPTQERPDISMSTSRVPELELVLVSVVLSWYSNVSNQLTPLVCRRSRQRRGSRLFRCLPRPLIPTTGAMETFTMVKTDGTAIPQVVGTIATSPPKSGQMPQPDRHPQAWLSPSPYIKRTATSRR